MMDIILLGKPASGKGTQGELLAKHFDLTLLTAGTLLRKFAQHDSDIGRSIKQSLERGDLVPDGLILWVVQEALREIDLESGIIFDGIPRMLNQALLLEEKLEELNRSINAIIYIDVSDESVVRRISGRKICSQNDQHIFHVDFHPPKQENICDICGGALYQRSDDSEERAWYRLKVYNEQTSPVVTHYQEQGILYTVDGEQPIDVISEQLIAFLAELQEKV